MIELRSQSKYAMVIPTSMGTRLTPVNGQPFHCSDTFMMQGTSAESNVGSVSSFLGLPVKILTAFVKGSPVARFIKDDLARRHMDYEVAPNSCRSHLGAFVTKSTWPTVAAVLVGPPRPERSRG